MDKRSGSGSGVYIQPNGSLIVQRGGIMTPVAGAKVTCVADIEALPWTRDQIVDAPMFRMCDEFVRLETTDWETKRKAMYAITYSMYGDFFDGDGNVVLMDDEMMRNILSYNQFAPENNPSIVEFWRLGDIGDWQSPGRATDED